MSTVRDNLCKGESEMKRDSSSNEDIEINSDDLKDLEISCNDSNEDMPDSADNE